MDLFVVVVVVVIVVVVCFLCSICFWGGFTTGIPYVGCIDMFVHSLTLSSHLLRHDHIQLGFYKNMVGGVFKDLGACVVSPVGSF